MVTGSRIAMKAQQEELGDLKLYAIPEPVTVAAKSQKQVAMIEQRGVKVELVYRSRLSAGNAEDGVATRTLVTRNRVADGLGIALPAGGVVLFANRGAEPILIGGGSLDDKAVGEDVAIAVGNAPGVQVSQVVLDRGMVELTVSNESPTLIRYEATIFANNRKLESRTRLGRRDGAPLWVVTVPANDRATLRYRYRPGG